MLYIINFKTDRWPAGDPVTGYLNSDGSPTKTQILNLHRKDTLSYLWDLSPVEAGSISGSGLNGVLNLSDSYTGAAQIKVKGSNSCGEGAWSPILDLSINPVPATPTTPSGETELCKASPNTSYSHRRLYCFGTRGN